MVDGDATANEEDAGRRKEPEDELFATVTVVMLTVRLPGAATKTDEEKHLIARVGQAMDGFRQHRR